MKAGENVKQAIMIGAGNIGRGFIGLLLEQAGCHVLFADVNDAAVRELNEKKEYTVHLVDEMCVDTVVSNISAVNSTTPEFIEEIAKSDLICTAVGLSVLPKVAPAIAKGVALRKQNGRREYLNIIACENAVRASSQLRELGKEKLSRDEQAYMEQYIGFPDCAVDRIVPRGNSASVSEVTVERYHEWDVEKSGIRGTLPPIEGMTLVDRLDAYLERKLFLLNGTHAVTAFYGHYKGYEMIGEALCDEEISTLARHLMQECSAVLTLRHGFSPRELAEYAATVLRRFRNPHIHDDVKRIAREPLRKLAPDDRLAAPVQYAHAFALAMPSYYTGIALALLYNEPTDAQSQLLQTMLAENGVEKTLTDVCGVALNETDIAQIKKEYECLKK